MREEFAEYARALYLASLDLHPDDDIGGFDALLLYDRVDSVNNNWGITRYQTYELPGELVAEGGDIKAYVNDTGRGEIILLYGFIGANDDEDLSTYTPENLEKRQKDYGVNYGNFMATNSKGKVTISGYSAK